MPIVNRVQLGSAVRRVQPPKPVPGMDPVIAYEHIYHEVIYVTAGHPDQGLPATGNHPDQGLPKPPGTPGDHPDQGLPKPPDGPNRPDHGLPGLPDVGLPDRPDNGLPNAPVFPNNDLPKPGTGWPGCGGDHVDNSLPQPPPVIDNTLPSAPPRVDNTLPPVPPQIDNTLPPTPEPKK